MDRIQLRRDSSARWAEINPILLEGEVGYEIDTKLRKIGDGVNRWNDLDYLRAEGISQETGNSQNITMSQDAITRELAELGSQVIYDVSANNDGATFASLSALLSSENLSTLIPIAVRCGGMSIRFAQTSDNKYAQYRLMSQTFSTIVADWQGVDVNPLPGSHNIVESGGVSSALGVVKNNLTTSNVQNGYVTPSGYEDTTTSWVHRHIFDISNKPRSRYKITTHVSNDIIAVCSVKNSIGTVLVVSQATTESKIFEFSLEDYPTAAFIVVSDTGTPIVEQTTLGSISDISKSISDMSERIGTNTTNITTNTSNLDKLLSKQTSLVISSTEVGYYTPTGYHSQDQGWTTSIYDISSVNDIVIAKTTVSNGIVVNALVKDENGTIILLGDASDKKKYFCFSKKEYPTAKYLYVSNTPSAWSVDDGILGDIYKEITKNKSTCNEFYLVNSILGYIINKPSQNVSIYNTEAGKYYTPTGYKASAGFLNIARYDISELDGIFIATTDTDNTLVAVGVVFDANGHLLAASQVASESKTWSFNKDNYPSAKYLCISYMSNKSLTYTANDRVQNLEAAQNLLQQNLEAAQNLLQQQIDNLSYGIQNALKGKTIAWFGTSIPAGWENGAGYPNRMGTLLGATVYNEAKGGSCANGKLEGNYTMNLYVLKLSLGHTIEQKLQIIDSCWNINDSNQTVSINSSNPLGITGIPQDYTYQQVIDYRWSVISLSYEIRLVVWHLISDATERENFLKAKLGNTLYNQIVNVEERDVSYKAADIFVFDHGNNDYNAGGYPYDSDDVTVFSGAINKFVETIYKWKPNSKVVQISNYRDTPSGVNNVIRQIAGAWGNPYIDVAALLPFKVFKKVATRGYWDTSKVWHETGFSWSESGDNYTTNLYLDGMDTGRVKGDLSLAQVKERINPTQIDGIWYWYANPIDIWLYDGLHPHQNGNTKVLQWYADTLAVEFINKVELYT